MPAQILVGTATAGAVGTPPPPLTPPAGSSTAGSQASVWRPPAARHRPDAPFTEAPNRPDAGRRPFKPKLPSAFAEDSQDVRRLDQPQQRFNRLNSAVEDIRKPMIDLSRRPAGAGAESYEVHL